MSLTKSIGSITAMAILAAALTSTYANAEPDQRSGKRRGPPPEAIAACADQTEGAACAFTGRRGEVEGSCIAPPQDQGELACAPEGGPPAGHGEQ
jgi:hypothetical protein